MRSRSSDGIIRKDSISHPLIVRVLSALGSLQNIEAGVRDRLLPFWRCGISSPSEYSNHVWWEVQQLGHVKLFKMHKGFCIKIKWFFGSMIIYVERDHDVTDEGHRPPLTKADLSTAHSWMTSPSGIEKKAEPPPVTISQGSWEVTGLRVTSWVLVPSHSTQFKSIVR